MTIIEKTKQINRKKKIQTDPEEQEKTQEGNISEYYVIFDLIKKHVTQYKSASQQGQNEIHKRNKGENSRQVHVNKQSVSATFKQNAMLIKRAVH